MQEPYFVITTDELRPEDVPLVNHGVVFFSLRKSIIIHAADHRRESSNLGVLLVDDLLIGRNELLHLRHFVPCGLILFIYLFMSERNLH